MNYLSRIAILVPSLENGGMERFAARLSLLLEQRGMKVFLFLLRYNRQKAYIHGGKIVVCSCEINNDCSKDGIISYMINASIIKEEKKKYDIEASISVSPEMNLLNILSRRNDRVICTIHNCMSLRNDIKSLAYIKKVMLLHNFSYKVVTVSDWCKNDLIDEYHIAKDKIVTIYNPYEVTAEVKHVSKNSTKPIVISVGRLEKIKQQWHIIKAFKYVNEKISDAELWLVGEGPEKNNLKKLAEELGIDKKVRFCGFVNNIEELYNMARISVLTSKSESFSYAAVESMANGVPIVASDFPGGIREVMGASRSRKEYPIKTKVGYIIKNFTDSNEYLPVVSKCENEMGRMLINIILDNEKYNYMSENCKILAQRFKSETICNQWISLLGKN